LIAIGGAAVEGLIFNSDWIPGGLCELLVHHD